MIVPGINGCSLDGTQVQPAGSWDYRPYNSCIEGRLHAEQKMELYVADTSGYNPSVVSYPCDSVEQKYKILKKYSVTLKELQQNSFALTYP
jgi:hypothetical protein